MQVVNEEEATHVYCHSGDERALKRFLESQPHDELKRLAEVRLTAV